MAFGFETCTGILERTLTGQHCVYLTGLEDTKAHASNIKRYKPKISDTMFSHIMTENLPCLLSS
jgi:hypothetical protein